MSLMNRHQVAKRVLDKQLDDLEKERRTRELFRLRDVKDIKRELKTKDEPPQEEAAHIVGRKSVKDQLPPITLQTRYKSQPSRLTLHRHSVDIADLTRFRAEMNKQTKTNVSVVSQMASILNQTKERSTKTSDEIWMEQFKDRFPGAAARVERSLKTMDVTDSKNPTPNSNRQSKVSGNRKSRNLERRSSVPDIPELLFDSLKSGGDKKSARVSFVEDKSRGSGNIRPSRTSREDQEFYRFGDDEGAWRSARRCRYLRNYDPPEMVLPSGENTSFVFGRNFNEALEQKRKNVD